MDRRLLCVRLAASDPVRAIMESLNRASSLLDQAGIRVGRECAQIRAQMRELRLLLSGGQPASGGVEPSISA